ncbi:hypothetical protein FACS1894216_13250 [Synergistales bacterium]|nr:hypothetical protein FACS1894216_13250 [Synergistales bacterium]
MSDFVRGGAKQKNDANREGFALYLRDVLLQNVRQILIVFLFFAIMVMVSYVSIRDIVLRNTKENAVTTLRTAESNISAYLNAAEICINNSASTLARMAERYLSYDDVDNYIEEVTNNLLANERYSPVFSGVFGVVNGVFHSGNPWPVSGEYFPKRELWYLVAKDAAGKAALTIPYTDKFTQKIVVSMTKEVITRGKIPIGVIAIDIYVPGLRDFIGGMFAGDGYGVIMNENMMIISARDENSVGKMLWNIPGFEEASNTLAANGEVSAMSIEDASGGHIVVFFRKIYNGWYIGSVLSFKDYYKSLNNSLTNLSLLGAAMSLVLSTLLIHMSLEKKRADCESESKTVFLARMSHEIRTPMNAIIGMSELALRENDPKSITTHLIDIKHAGNHMLSIINDILDFSAIESGKFTINPIPYNLSSLVSDVVNVTRVRMINMKRPVSLAVNVQCGIPRKLRGDEYRIRQVMLNILSNAVKYTMEGNIIFTVSCAPIDQDSVYLSFTIEDSGIGIKEEDMKNLFENFSRFDTDRNRGVEGTGLGLAITYRLVKSMDGKIKVSSVYGKGSAFTAIIPQLAVDHAPTASVKDAGKKNVILRDDRKTYRESILTALQDLGVPVAAVADTYSLIERLRKEDFAFAFVTPAAADEVSLVIDKFELRTEVVILTDLEDVYTPRDKNNRILRMPAYSITIANILDNVSMTERAEGLAINFTAPGALILIVDDNKINLAVAKGLLSPYKAAIDTCERGEDSLALARTKKYDLIFMDHAMPGMDGIEVTERLRGMPETESVPIIALTANAVSGMREIFLSKGMNDFLAKPIEPAKLDEILRKWLPGAKIVPQAEPARAAPKSTEDRAISDQVISAVNGLDAEKAIARFGAMELYIDMLSVYAAHTGEVLDKLREPEENNLKDYAVAVHGLKGSSYGICANIVGKMAEELEKNSKSGDLDAVLAQNNDMLAAAGKLIADIKAALEEIAPAETKEARRAPDAELLKSLLSACESYDFTRMELVLGELRSFKYEEGGELVSWLAEQAENLEYAAITDKLKKEIG